MGPLYFSFHLFVYPSDYLSRAREHEAEWKGNQQALRLLREQVLKVGGQRGQFVLRRPSDQDGFIILARRCIIRIFQQLASPSFTQTSSSRLSIVESNKENAIFFLYGLISRFSEFLREGFSSFFFFLEGTKKKGKKISSISLDSWINSSRNVISFRYKKKKKKRVRGEEKMYRYRVAKNHGTGTKPLFDRDEKSV